MRKCNEFTSINNWRNFLRETVTKALFISKNNEGDVLYAETTPPTIINGLKCTHKIGGTNASVVKYANNPSQLVYQSRTQILDDSDNLAFKFYISAYESDLHKFIDYLYRYYNSYNAIGEIDNIAVYGEWCGSGVKEKHSISKISSKKWIVFAIKITPTQNEPFYVPVDLHLIQFKSIFKDEIFDNVFNWKIDDEIVPTINLSNMAWGCWEGDKTPVPNDLEKLTNDLTLNCPVAKQFGVMGIGEGLVFYQEVEGDSNYPHTVKYLLKVKNAKYEGKQSELKTTKTIDHNLQYFVDNIAATNGRLEQFLIQMQNTIGEIDKKHIVDFQNLVIADVYKECLNEIETLPDREWEAQVRKKCATFFFKELSRIQKG